MTYNKFRPGDIVRSVSGHDAGILLLVLDTDGRYCITTDGNHRKAGHPKRKNALHLQLATGAIASDEYTDDDGSLSNKKIRSLLARYATCEQ